MSGRSGEHPSVHSFVMHTNAQNISHSSICRLRIIVTLFVDCIWLCRISYAYALGREKNMMMRTKNPPYRLRCCVSNVYIFSHRTRRRSRSASVLPAFLCGARESILSMSTRPSCVHACCLGVECCLCAAAVALCHSAGAPKGGWEKLANIHFARPHAKARVDTFTSVCGPRG